MSERAIFSEVEKQIQAGMDEGLHVGAQLCVARGGRVMGELALGEAAPGLAMGADSLMIWLSAGKPMTAVAIGQLYEQGRLDLDDPVARYLPAFGREGKEAITVGHLLTHTAGVRSAGFRFPEDSWDRIIEAICEAPLEEGWTPGESAGYHVHTAWFVLGEIVQRLSGESVDVYLRDHVFEPLGMADSWLGMPEWRRQGYADRLGVMLNTAEDPPRPAGYEGPLYVTAPAPGSNLHATARDMVRFYRAMLGGGELDGARVLERETVELLTHRHRRDTHDQTFGQTVDWGLGFIVNSRHHGSGVPYQYGPHASAETFGHGGNQSSTAFADPAHELAVALVFNGMPGERAHQRRVEPVLAAIYEAVGVGGVG